MNRYLIEKYFRYDKLPHIWCPGCGHGIILGALIRSIENLRLNTNKICVVSGIGCSSRAPGYLNFDTLHTTHGRALAFATGVKLANPELKVIVITGDGDCTAIGGNHLIHAARRNIDITTILFNNNIYGMTGGQYSPTTPQYEKGTTAPYGNIEKSFDACKLSASAGATYVARGTVYHTHQLIKLLEKAIMHKGFSFVEAVSVCPTYYGRKNKKGTVLDMLDWLRENSIDVGAAQKLTAEQLKGKIIIGEFVNSEEPEYTAEYERIIKGFKKGDSHG